MSSKMKLVFTSYRKSMELEGLKVSIDKHAPKLCPHATLNWLVIPVARNLSRASVERICNITLDNNWHLMRDFICQVHKLGVYQIVLCCWCTEEQILQGKHCFAGIIGKYMQGKIDRDGEFSFPIEISYGDGRKAL